MGVYINNKQTIFSDTIATKTHTSLRDIIERTATEVTIPQGINRLGLHSLCNLGIQELYIPPSVTNIGERAVSNCPSLKQVYIAGDKVTISKNAFIYDSSITDIYVPWVEGEVPNAPWGADRATIHYNYYIEDSFSIFSQKGLLGSAAGRFSGVNNNKELDDTNYFAHSASAVGMRIYSCRHYSRKLEQWEIQQNHYVDLLKFFRIHIGLKNYRSSTKEKRRAVYKRVAESGVTFESDWESVWRAIGNDFGMGGGISDITAEQYDELYVQNGLTFAIDFFKTNEYWNTENKRFEVPTDPNAYTAYEYDGKTHNLTMPWNILVYDESEKPIDGTPAFKDAVAKWYEEDMTFFANFTTKTTQSDLNKKPISMHSYAPLDPNCGASLYVDEARWRAKFTAYKEPNSGYIEVESGLHPWAGICISWMDNHLPVHDSCSLDFQVALGGNLIADSRAPIIFHNIHPSIKLSEDEDGSKCNFNGFSSDSKFSPNENHPLTSDTLLPNNQTPVHLVYSLEVGRLK